ncbi:hypothetical protein DH2020_009261 [Rehmannia glutinosa]|uniref:Ninja-family protein n=1 Tax=Rehmannia glutinosa TaxID=99300 RepID=A0ABR0X6M6_REHGL
MEGAEGNREKFKFPARMNGFSSDLLRKFTKKSSDYPNGNEEEEEEDEEIELSLGLSMNGRFGVDPARKKLKRSSSVANLVFTVGAVENETIHHARGMEFDVYAPLARTRSLPTETEEEWRRRKELQSMRRMEARRKRMEKLKNLRVVKDKENCFQKDVKNGLHEVVVNGSAINGQRLENAILHGFENGDVSSSPQGSIESLRSGSSGVSDPVEGAIQNSEVPPPSLDCSHEHEPASRAADRDSKGAGKLLKNAMLDMPYVSTKGNGPNGRKIEGFLYRYKKGEEVRIVCVCHGMFLTPKEFVEHGGGGDVEQPLKHIVVNPFPLL